MKKHIILASALIGSASFLPAASLSWNGGAGAWDTTTPNWTDAGASSATFTSGDDARFSGTAGTVTVSSTIMAGTVTFDSAGYSISNMGAMTWSGLAGAANFTKNGTGSLTIEGNNTYSGQMTLSGGTVNFSGDHSSFTGSIRASSGTINFASGSTISIINGKNLHVGDAGGVTLNVYGTLNNTGTFTSGYGANVTLKAGGTWNQSGSFTLLRSSSTYQNANFTQEGGVFNYTGSSSILVNSNGGGSGQAYFNLNGGHFNTDQGFAKSVNGQPSNLSMNGGTIRLTADIGQLASVTGGTGTFNFILNTKGGVIDTNGFNTTLNRNVGGTGSLTKSGAGMLILSGENTYAGLTAVNGGTLSVTGTIQLNTAGITVASGASLALSGTLKLSSDVATIDVDANGDFTAGGMLNLNGLFDTSGGADATYALVTGAGTKGGGFSVTGYDTGVWSSVTFDGTTGVLSFTAVPEPSTYGLMGAGALAMAVT